ncbi:XopAW family type III secretion system calcium-binding effector [Agrobacterium larrymoorei]|uniref:EF-hand domain-containing protein n=1 Tax=Agrobacterium larrymoorei TaxID=160699 RepID=A0A4D7DRB4_9HYPH|nr:XopAW family type III secretion system calcium-binding effector [Agrobacterium larrymoorei]QCI98237.1 hypothetical protein CFBP5473_10155 [Agrobacterium larrymoorei]QYA06311.1 EF-hand domain-containing protein [Agrobacterium larrymoorei]
MSTVSSTYNYQYERNLQSLSKSADSTVNYDDSSASTSSTVTKSSSGSALSSDSTDSGSALNQLLSTLMTLVMNLSQGASTETASQDSGQSETDYFNSLDTDGSGSLSQTEFTSARPDDVTEDMANNLFTQLDADGDGTLSTEELAAKDAAPNGAPPPPPAEEEDSISSLDTNGDGVVSQAEFLAARPDEVSEEDATSLFSQIDSDGDGTVSQEELEASRQPDGPPPPPPSADDISSDLAASGLSLDDLISQLEEISKAYQSYGVSEETTSSSITV